MDIALKAKRIFANNLFMTLATTSSNGLPWSTPVFYAVDNQNNFFWYSRKDAKHSQNIKENNKVSASIFSTTGDDEGVGVYIEGEAYELGENELDYATKTYAAKAAGSEAEREFN